MPMKMPVNNLSYTLELDWGENRKEKLTLIGPSFLGWIYQSEKGQACCRVIPITEAPLDKRDRVRQWINKARQLGIAPIVEAEQIKDKNNKTVFVVRYEIRPQRTWVDILADPDPAARIEYAIRILRQLPAWWEKLIADPHECLLPMPSDIVFVDDIPQLLAMPFWGLPNLEAVFAIPQRGLYLAPEVVRGSQNQIWGRNIDIYAIGVALFQCLFTMPVVDNIEKLLSKIANNSLFSLPNIKSNLPFWLEQFAASQKAISIIRQAIDPNLRMRSAVDPAKMVSELEIYHRQMDPKSVVNSMRQSGRSDKAFTLLQDILLEQNSYELLLLAGKIAWEDLNRPLETIDFMERAIAKDRGRPEAFEEQFEVITTGKERIGIHLLIEQKKSASEELDNRAWRDFQHMLEPKQEEHEVKMARYLLWRKQYETAARFIYSRLFNDQKIYLWWKFGMTLAYTEAFIELNKLAEAHKLVVDIKSQLAKVRDNKTVPFEKILEYGAILSGLEVRLYNKRSKSQL